MTSVAAWWVLALLSAADLHGDPRFADAQRLYKDLEYEQALEGFLLLAAEADSASPSERAELSLWIGLSRGMSGDTDAARAAFDAALALDRALTLPTRTSPKLLALFDACVAALPPPVAVVDVELAAPDPPPPAAVEGPTSTMPAVVAPPVERRKPPEEKQSGAPTMMMFAGAAGLGFGALAAGVGAVAFGVDAWQSYAVASDLSTDQLNADTLVKRANGGLAWSTVLAGAAVAGGAGAAVLATVALSGE